MEFEGVRFTDFEPRTSDTYPFTWACSDCLDEHGFTTFIDGPEITSDEDITCGVALCDGPAKYYIYPWTPIQP